MHGIDGIALLLDTYLVLNVLAVSAFLVGCMVWLVTRR